MSKVSDFYDDPDEFEADLDSAGAAAVTAREIEFVSGLRDKFDEWGVKMFLSDAQHAWLQRIIDGD